MQSHFIPEQIPDFSTVIVIANLQQTADQSMQLSCILIINLQRMHMRVKVVGLHVLSGFEET